MANETLNLALMLSLKDNASGGLDLFAANVRRNSVSIERDIQRLKQAGQGQSKAVVKQIEAQVADLKREAQLLDAANDRMNALRAKMGRSGAMIGVGAAGLATLYGGAKIAGDLETAKLDLRRAFQEKPEFSQFSFAQQEEQIKRLMALSTDLGNNLQGSTQDYVQMMTALNKSGVDAETTLSGAGRAAAYLANVSGALTKGGAPELAKDLGAFGKMFDLKGNDYLKAVDLLAALDDRFDIQSGNLIEASKYFFSTAKTALDLRGLEGAQDTAKLFAFAKRYAGREGSEAGTSLDAVITQYIAHKDKVEALAKDKGIKLEFFNAEGKFGGIENMFAQLEKLRSLAPEERSLRLNDIFGEQGARIAGAMVEQGVAGWKNITAESNKAVGVNQQINQQMATFNAKLEAAQGSAMNLAATAFTPMLDDLKIGIDYTSKLVNQFQQFSEANPALTGTVTKLALLGTTSLIVLGSFNALKTGWQLWRIAAAVSSGSTPIPYLNQTTAAANTGAAAMTTAATRATGLKGALAGIAGSTVVRVGVSIAAVMGLEYAISSAVDAAVKAIEAKNNAKKATADSFSSLNNLEKEFGVVNGRATKSFDGFDAQAELERNYKLRGSSAFALLNTNNSLHEATGGGNFNERFGRHLERQLLPQMLSPGGGNLMLGAYNNILRPLSGAMFGMQPLAIDSLRNPFTGKQAMINNPYQSALGGFNKQNAVQMFREKAPDLQNTGVMMEFIRTIEARLPKEQQAPIKDALNTAFPATFASAMQQINGSVTTLNESFLSLSQSALQQQVPIQQTTEALNQLPQPLTTATENITNLGDAANKGYPALSNVGGAANNASSGLNSLGDKLSSWQPPTPQIQVQTIQVPTGGAPPNPSPNGYNLFGVPSRAVGGTVQRDGMAYVHSGEDIVPAEVTRGYGRKAANLNSLMRSERAVAPSASVSLTYSPTINVNDGSPKTQQKIQQMLAQHSRDLEQKVEMQMARSLQIGRERA